MTHDAWIQNPEVLEKIFLASRLVCREEIAPDKAAVKLAEMNDDTPEAVKVYFDMYAHMRQGRIFKQSGGDPMIIYFLQRIAQEDGDRALAFALKSVYGFSGFKESVGCYIDDLNKACADIQRITGVKPAGA